MKISHAIFQHGMKNRFKEEIFMRILILGGTVFLGRHLVEAALERGHEVTLFNRGKTNQDLFTDVEKLTGDRASNLESLKGREWDVVIDPSGYLPGVVAETASLLKDAVERYIFISSISVYRDFQEQYVDEGYPVGKLEDESVTEINGETYGPLKALCEKTVEEIMPGQTLSIRPGLIVGPHDPSDRFTYWVERFARGGDVLVPGKKDRPVQWIDVRDLSQWIIQMAEQKETGVYNATGYDKELTMDEFVNVLNQHYEGAIPVWVDDACLLKHAISPFTELPMWIPVTDQHPHGFILASNQKALEKGLSFRTLSETIKDTLAWYQSRLDPELKNGLDAEKEALVLEDCTST